MKNDPTGTRNIAPDVKLGRDVKICDFVNLYGCGIGDNTKIGPFVEIQKGTKVGKSCKISSHTFICEGVTSRLEVANELLAILGLEKEIKINEVSSDFFRKEYFAPRPDSERLINKKLNLRGLNIMRNWKIALRDYLENYYKDYI